MFRCIPALPVQYNLPRSPLSHTRLPNNSFHIDLLCHSYVPGLPLFDVHILFVELLRGIITSELQCFWFLPGLVFQGSAKGQS